jgi:protein-L-isoaspartate(D-aspartate) O-methyltransferase
MRRKWGDRMNSWEALRAVPRREFIPDTVWIRREDGWAVPIRRQDNPSEWEKECRSDDSIIIQVDDGKSVDKGIWPTSSSSAPRAMAAMLDVLDIRPEMRVLEIGTGTGYNAGVLAHMAGAENVTTIEIDPSLGEHARHALHKAGYPVEVIIGEGIDGYAPNAPYDRIIVTAAVHEIPYSWIEQVRPSGLLVVPWAITFHPDAPLAVLTVGRDGTAEGRFVAPSGFMPIRSQRVSQATIRKVDEAWISAGKPSCTRYGVTVRGNGQTTVWLDRPDNQVVQTR